VGAVVFFHHRKTPPTSSVAKVLILFLARHFGLRQIQHNQHLSLIHDFTYYYQYIIPLILVLLHSVASLLVASLVVELVV